MQRLSQLVWLIASLTLTMSLVGDGVYSIPIGALFLLSLISLCFLDSGLSKTLEDRYLIYTWCGFTLFMAWFVFLDGWHTRELDRPARFLLAIPVLLLLMRLPLPKIPFLFYGVISGAFASLIVASHDRFWLDLPRAQGGENAIMFGDTAMMLGFMSCAALMYFYAKRQSVMCLLSVLGVLSGVSASFLSGSRGGWIAAPFIAFFILWQSRELFSRKLLMGGIAMAMTSLALAVAIPQTGIQHRIQAAFVDLGKYQQGDSNTSVGLRLDMWKSSFYLVAESPVFGEGQYGSSAIREELAAKGVIHPHAAKFDHLHNEYLTSLGFQGIVGLVCLLLVYLVPLRLFMKKVKRYDDNWEIKPYALAGALIPMCYMDFALTQAMFSHNIGVMMYAFPIIFFWVALRWQERHFATCKAG